MTQELKDLLKTVKKQYKKSKKNIILFKEQRDNLVRQMLSHSTPNWGGIKLTLSKI